MPLYVGNGSGEYGSVDIRALIGPHLLLNCVLKPVPYTPSTVSFGSFCRRLIPDDIDIDTSDISTKHISSYQTPEYTWTTITQINCLQDFILDPTEGANPFSHAGSNKMAMPVRLDPSNSSGLLIDLSQVDLDPVGPGLQVVKEEEMTVADIVRQIRDPDTAIDSWSAAKKFDALVLLTRAITTTVVKNELENFPDGREVPASVRMALTNCASMKLYQFCFAKSPEVWTQVFGNREVKDEETPLRPHHVGKFHFTLMSIAPSISLCIAREQGIVSGGMIPPFEVGVPLRFVSTEKKA